MIIVISVKCSLLVDEARIILIVSSNNNNKNSRKTTRYTQL